MSLYYEEDENRTDTGPDTVTGGGQPTGSVDLDPAGDNANTTTMAYSDGATATGPGTLPESSPAQQDRVESQLEGVNLPIAPKPTIGRRVWYWSEPIDGLYVIDNMQPFDAGIVFVHQDGRVNLDVCDHVGNHRPALAITLVQPGAVAPCHGSGIAQWMPIQTNRSYAERGVPA